MRKRYLVISIGVLVGALGIVAACGAFSFGHVSVRKASEMRLSALRSPSIDVQMVTNGGKTGADGSVLIESVINQILLDAGVSETANAKDATVLITCRFRTGWCLPYLGRHLDGLHWSAPRWMSIVVTDKEHGSVICEVEYQRPILSTRPRSDLIARMFTAGFGEQPPKRQPE